MTIREEVRAFADLGPLPAEDTAGEDQVWKVQRRLEAITPPLSRDEALLLLESFGDDTCFGLAWKLLHLIETGPNPAVRTEPSDGANEWIRRLWQRATYQQPST